jgi:hypothetical protein
MKSGKDDGEDAKEDSDDKEYWASSRRYCSTHYYVPSTTRASTTQAETTQAPTIRAPVVENDPVAQNDALDSDASSVKSTYRAERSASGDVPDETG